MAQKNWLIRTKNKQILGPATKEKVIELIEKGSLTSDDEIACGNGYWFWVKERDLLEKYLYGDLPQTFNPISEAQDVLTAKTTPDGITASIVDSPQQAKAKSTPTEGGANQLPDDDDLAYPDEGDLEYPDLGDMDTSPSSASEVIDATDPMMDGPSSHGEDEPLDHSTGEIELSEVTQELTRPSDAQLSPAPGGSPSSSEEEENFLYPSAEDLEYPVIPGQEFEEDHLDEDQDGGDEDRTDPNVYIPDVNQEAQLLDSEDEDDNEITQESLDDTEDEDIAPKKKKGKKRGKRKRKVVAEPKSNDRYLIYIAVFIMIAIGVVIYYYKSVLNKPLPVIGMQEAHAQTLSSLSKKKTSSP